MIQNLLDVLDGWGMAGLLIVMAIEGSSLPFPGIILILAYGYVLNPTIPEVIASAVAMSLVYSLASYLPYGIGFKLDALLPLRFRRKLLKAQQMFRRYGQWSIALSRPFGVGNYISYVAGMCKVKAVNYGVLTFLGVLPWAIAMLFLGRIFKGNGQAITLYFQDYQWYLYATLIAVLSAFVTVWYYRRNRRGVRSTGERGGPGR